MRFLLASVAFVSLAGCASRTEEPLPVADRVCISFEGLSSTEVNYVVPISRERLKSYGMQLVDQDCQVLVKYGRLASVAGSSRTFLSLGLSSKTTIGEDGLLTISAVGAASTGEPINVSLRGSNTAADSLFWLGQEIVDLTQRSFRPSISPR